MTLESTYGSRPDLLPRSMIRVVRAGQEGDRRLAWRELQGVELLNLSQHNQYERESLSRYPRNADGTIDWNAVADELILSSTDSDSNELNSVLEQNGLNSGDLVFFWESLAVPSVKINADAVPAYISDIAETFAEFWIYFPEGRIILEYSFFGAVTVARVPTWLSSAEGGNSGEL